MKKFLIILLLGMYSFSVSGMTLHFNYCCGELSSIELIPTENCNQEDEPVTCCSELEVQASLDDATHSKTFEFFKLCCEAEHCLHQPFTVFPPGIQVEHYPDVIQHFFTYGQPLYLLHRVWRI
ncbi:MAG: hypothetical protein KF880_01645 [Ferruginibacter sp.]|nr:hypothetical protein [Ferruginibacter sp.]